MKTLKMGDDHPQGDPKKRKIQDLLQNIFDKDIQYFFTEINDSTKQMIEVFNREINFLPNGHQITTYRLSSANDLINTIVTSLTVSIAEVKTKTLHQKDNAPKVYKNKKIRQENLNFDDLNLKEHDAEIYEFKFIGTIEDIKKLKQDYNNKITGGKKLESLIKPARRTAKVKLCESPFNKGNLRYAYAAKIEMPDKSYKHAVAKHSLYVDNKKDSYEEIKKGIIIQVISKYLGELFLIESKSKKKISFLNVQMIQLLDTYEYYSVEDFLYGTFKKWSGTLGMMNPTIYSKTLVCFSHWVYEKTDNYMIVTDLQGFERYSLTENEEEYVLTDPALSCIEMQFNDTDFGQYGIIKFFNTHKCNDHCFKAFLNQTVKLPNSTVLELELEERDGGTRTWIDNGFIKINI